MKCKLCGKNGGQLSHWRTQHKDYMRRRAASPEARAKAARTRARTKASEKAGKAPGSSRKRKRSRSTSEASESLPDAPVGFVVETVTYRRA